MKMEDREYHNLINCQDKLNEMIKYRKDDEGLAKAFKEYTSKLRCSGCVTVVKKMSIPCVFCQGPSKKDAKSLGCGHYICSFGCFKNLVKKTIEKITRYDQLKCSECHHLIPTSITKEFYGGDTAFRNLLNSDEFVPKVMCNICTETYPITRFKTFDCEHRFCIDCVTGLVLTLISEGDVGDAICCSECSRPLDPQLVFSVLDVETREKYDEFLLRNINVKENEKLVRCIGKPGINCEYKQIVSKDRDEYECPQCGAIFCPKCNKEVHRKMKCEEFALLQNTQDPMIKEEIQKGNMALCPWCFLPICKDKGCKYMACPSKECKDVRFFCWDCRAKLTERHQEHSCITKDVISNRFKRFFKNLFS